jgi:ribonuclease D
MSHRMFQPGITSEELSQLPVISYQGDIRLVDRSELVRPAVQSLRNQKVLGFDTETKPSFKKGVVNKVSLLQLATNQEVFLFRLNRIGLPESIADILSDENIVKVGAAIRDDIKILQKLRVFSPAGFVDLQHIVKDFGIESKGVRQLAGIILGGRVSKAQQLTNWEATEISDNQKVYAATDAWVCLEMFQKLSSIKR